MAVLATNVKEFIAQLIDVSIDMVTDDANLKDDLIVDELGRSQLTTALLERFDIYITDEDTDQFTTIQDIIDYVETKLWWYSQ